MEISNYLQIFWIVFIYIKSALLQYLSQAEPTMYEGDGCVKNNTHFIYGLSLVCKKCARGYANTFLSMYYDERESYGNSYYKDCRSKCFKDFLFEFCFKKDYYVKNNYTNFHPYIDYLNGKIPQNETPGDYPAPWCDNLEQCLVYQFRSNDFDRAKDEKTTETTTSLLTTERTTVARSNSPSQNYQPITQPSNSLHSWGGKTTRTTVARSNSPSQNHNYHYQPSNSIYSRGWLFGRGLG